MNVSREKQFSYCTKRYYNIKGFVKRVCNILVAVCDKRNV